MATLQKPKLLLLDEHTAALDPATSAKVLKLTCEIVAKQNLTAMMVTHNMRCLLYTSKRITHSQTKNIHNNIRNYK